MSSDTTIMMVTYNRLKLTKDTFKLALNTAGKKFNLIIVDNGSADGTVEWLRSKDYHCEYVESTTLVMLPENRGIAYGRNAALKAAKAKRPNTRYYCTLDNDIGIRGGWLADCCEVVEYVPRIGMCGVNLEGNTYPSARIKLGDGRPLTIQIKPKGNLGAVCTVFTNDVQKKLGYFCEDYKLYGHEDADYGFRIRMLGLGLAYLNEPGIDLCDVYKGIDEGEYRDFKNKLFKDNLDQFQKNAAGYAQKRKSLHIDFSEDIQAFIE